MFPEYSFDSRNMVLLVVIGGIGLLLWIYFNTYCPSCWRFLSRVFKRREVFGEKTVFKDEDKNTGREDGNGQTIYVKVRVPYIRTDVRKFWICRWCGHEYHTDGSEDKPA